MSHLKVVDDSSIPSLQASKWLQQQMFLSERELELLFDELGDFHIFNVGEIVPLERVKISRESYLKNYSLYLSELRKGKIPEVTIYRKLFSAVISVTLDALFLYRISGNEYLVRIAQPIIQMQGHSMHFSQHDHKFRPMIFGPDCITWGLQFSYPQIYQDPATMKILKVDDHDTCPNTQLFRRLQRWQRKQTIPTPFCIGDINVNVPMRLGKECVDWINDHAQLKALGIEVKAS